MSQQITVQLHLEDQAKALRRGRNKSEEKLAAEIAALQGALEKSRNNHVVAMQKASYVR